MSIKYIKFSFKTSPIKKIPGMNGKFPSLHNQVLKPSKHIIRMENRPISFMDTMEKL